MILRKVISGGQTGVDQAGLFMAKKYGFVTGGWAPRHFMTSTGSQKDLLMSFGLKEHSGGYRDRAWKNVMDSNATIRLAFNFNSPGEKCTLKAIKRYKRPHYDINLQNPVIPEIICEWIKINNVEVLNIAGNTETNLIDKIVYNAACNYLDKFFLLVRGQK
jgi:hypothetical protein